MTKVRINTHCHFLNFQCFPRKIIRKFMGYSEVIFEFLAFLSNLSPKTKIDLIKKYPRGFEFLEIIDSPISIQVRNYMEELNNSGFNMCVPLMMDLEPGAHQDITTPHDLIPYIKRIDEISKITAKYPWQIFPFIMFDPRRKDSYFLCREAIETKGFIGIKIYPALGYSPYWEHNQQRWGDLEHTISEEEAYRVAKQQYMMYEYCQNNNIPITTHTSTGGPFDVNLSHKTAWALTAISNWEAVLNVFKDLKINFAHFGGEYFINNNLYSQHFANQIETNQTQWRDQIIALIKGSKNVYADLSYHDMAFKDPQYFPILKTLLENIDLKEKILFGSDFPMISHSYSENEYITQFKTALDKQKQDLIMTTNPAKFLFGSDLIIPTTYINFLKKHNNKAIEDVTQWKWIESDPQAGTFKVKIID